MVGQHPVDPARSATASAGGGNSDVATTHPGHAGYLNSDFTGGGVPTAHFHNLACFPTCYTPSPGGWGGAVSDAAKGGGIPGAHG